MTPSTKADKSAGSLGLLASVCALAGMEKIKNTPMIRIMVDAICINNLDFDTDKFIGFAPFRWIHYYLRKNHLKVATSRSWIMEISWVIKKVCYYPIIN